MKNIGLIGRKRSGKDTAAGFLVERGYERIGFADALKDAALALDPIIHQTEEGEYRRLSALVANYGWEICKDEFPEVRRVLQHMGEAIREVLGDHSWRNVALAKVEAANALGRPAVISDVRYPDEAAHLSSLGFTLVRITRPGIVAEEGEHVSESHADSLRADIEISNDGTVAQLRDAIEAVAAETISS